MTPLGLAGGSHEMTRIVSFGELVVMLVTTLDSIKKWFTGRDM
jgi:hypothetical protein